MVIFCATRGGTERAAHLLRGFLDDSDIRFYHAGLQKNEKKAVEAWFHGHERGILVTTCAWGMGVDKKNVRTVIHRDAPPTAEAYAQESGRGGRDGKTAQAVLLWSPAEKKRFARLSELQKNRAMSLVHLAESGRCRREVLLSALGETRADASQRGGEQIACSGCDVCNRSARFFAGDEAVVREYIRSTPRCFSREQIATSLYTAGNRLSLSRSGFREWQRTDFTLIIDELEKEGVISELKYWPWKGKLSICRTVTSCHPSPSRKVFRLPALPEWHLKEELPADEPSFSSQPVSVSGNGQCN
jgi:ATP-dependent DNA helicase RecQ